MNQTKIEWCDMTLNPVVGCPHNCDYCYARRQAKRQKQRCKLCYDFIPHPHLERLDQLKPTQKPKRIFLDSMWDWCSAGVKKEWLETILAKIRQCPQHTFQILSKRPNRYSRFSYPENVWLGTSVATNADLYRIHDLSRVVPHNIRFVSIEPIHEKLDFWFTGKAVDWIIIGAETGHRKGRIVPEPEWISSLVENGKAENIPVFIKDNVKYSCEVIRDFPI